MKEAEEIERCIKEEESKEFPDYQGENVSVLIALLQGIVDNSSNKKDILIALIHQRKLASNWKFYEDSVNKYFDFDGIYLMKLQHLLCPLNRTGLSMADKIIAKDLMKLAGIKEYCNNSGDSPCL